VTFDESNGSQGHISSDIVGNEKSPCEAIKKLAIGEVRPQEKDDDEGTIWMINEVIDRAQRWWVINLPSKQTHQPQVIQSLKKFINHKRCQQLWKTNLKQLLVKFLLNKRMMMGKFKDNH
jgi:hypothetical protein